MANSTAKDWAKKGFALTEGNNLKHVSTLTDKPAKVKKLPPLLERAIPAQQESEATETGGTIYIKPLSTNRAYRGKIFKTEYHKNYIVAVLLLLPNNIVIPDGPLKATIEFGLSSNAGDIDNPQKTFFDCLATKYGFNDSRIMESSVKKAIVKKGKEYIRFSISAL